MQVERKFLVFLIICSLYFLCSQCSNTVKAQKYLNNGKAWYEKGDYDKAIAGFDKAIELDSKYAEAYYNRGFAWFKKGVNGQAIIDFNKAIELDPKSAPNYAIRGFVWFQNGEYDKAISDYSKAIDLDPKYAEDYFYRGLAWYEKSDYNKAIADYNSTLCIDPKHILSYVNRGLACYRKGEYERAIADYDKALGLDEKNDLALNNKAWILATCPNKRFRDGVKALELAQRAVDLQSGKSYLDTLAASFAEVGKYKEAIVYQEKAIELSKQNGEDENEIKDLLKCLNNYKADKPWRE